MAGSIEEAISNLYEMVQDAWSLPLGADKCVLERDKVLDLLDEMNNQLPSEFKQAKTIVDARNDIVGSAKRESEALLKQAELKAQQMISEQEVYKQANLQAEKILADANARAKALTESTDAKLKALRAASISFVLDALEKTQTSIQSALGDVTTAKSQLESMNPVPQNPEIAPKEAE